MSPTLRSGQGATSGYSRRRLKCVTTLGAVSPFREKNAWLAMDVPQVRQEGGDDCQLYGFVRWQEAE